MTDLGPPWLDAIARALGDKAQVVAVALPPERGCREPPLPPLVEPKREETR